jgi:hypothetical protein
VGAVGKHFERLYAERRSGEFQRLNTEMIAHGMPSFGEMGGLPADELQAMIAMRTAAALKEPAKAFILLPIAALCDKDGALDTLRRDGVKLTPVA